MNLRSLTAGRPRRWPLVVAIALAIPVPALADAVTSWNATATTVVPRLGSPQFQARGMAMVQIAVHDALNSIRPRYRSYTGVAPANPGASPDAAVAAATRTALLALLPDGSAEETTVETAYTTALSAIPDGAAKSDGIAAGTAAAAAILALRANDGSANPNRPYVEPLVPGRYQPTPSTPDPTNPAVITPLMQGWAELVPFALRRGDQFRVDPSEIFNLAGPAYAREFNQVKTVGDARERGTAPNSRESDIGRFWAAGGFNWNPIARGIVAGRSLDRWQNARLFALLNMAVSDANIAAQDSKYAYKFWRPVTAIRRAAEDGNPATAADPYWTPLLVTPPYPDYPCNLPSGASASAETLRRYFGTDQVPFTRTAIAPVVPLPAPLAAMPEKTITRSYASLSAAANESAISRVYAGIHFLDGCRASVRQARAVAAFVFTHYLKPIN
jgi:hypothetical protein